MRNHSVVGGVLSIVAGAFGVFWLLLGLFFVSVGYFAYKGPYYDGYYAEWASLIFVIAWCLVFALLGALAIIGGVSSIRRKLWGLALAGAIAGTLVFFPCGIAAIIFIALAKPEFDVLPRPEQTAVQS